MSLKNFLSAFVGIVLFAAQALAGGGGIEHENCHAQIKRDLSAVIVVYGNPFFQEVGNGVEVLPEPAPDPSKDYYYSVTSVDNAVDMAQVYLRNTKDKPLGEKLILLFDKKGAEDKLVVSVDGKPEIVPLSCEFEPE